MLKKSYLILFTIITLPTIYGMEEPVPLESQQPKPFANVFWVTLYHAVQVHPYPIIEHNISTQANRNHTNHYCDINARTICCSTGQQGDTPLHLAAWNYREDWERVYNLFRAHGADDTIANHEGITPKQLYDKRKAKVYQEQQSKAQELSH